MLYLEPIKLLETLENLIEEGKSTSEIFIYLHQKQIMSFSGKPFSVPMLNHTLLTIKNPEYRSASVVAQLLKARNA